MPTLYTQLYRRHGKPDGISRREMLQRSLGAAAALLMSDSLMGLPRAAAGRVIVVGGGFSGLAAAYELSKAGYDVTVAEARNRIGGRVLSFSDLVAGKNVEGGGELIGSNHPAWVGYAKQFGLRFLDVTEEDLESPIMLGGKRLTSDESDALWEEMEKAFNTIVTDAAKVDADEPWKAANADALDKRTLASWIDGLSASPLCKAGLHAMMMSDNGMVTQWQSYLGNLAMVKGGGLEKYWTESEVYRCQGGNQQLARKFAESIGPTRVLTRTIVRSIAVTDKSVRVTLANGKVLEGDHVVLSAPPPVWNRIAIDPALPAGLAPQMGSNVKFLMALNGPFWRRAELGPEILTDGPVSATWHATDGQRGAGEAMVAFSGGTAADTCREWTPTARTENYLSELQKIYKGIRPSFVRARFMDWPSDPWVKASYSFPAPGQVTTQGPTFKQGLGRLHFAGEHTCYAFMGYMEGALNSGAAVARRIAVKDGVLKGSPGVSRQNLRLVLGLVAIVVMFKACDREGEQQTRNAARQARETREVDQELTPQTTVEAKEGLAAAIAIDVSGSMDEAVAGQNGRKEPKIDIARRAALDLVEQFARYARDHQDEPVLLGIYEFSRRRGEPDCRPVVAMGPPDRERAAAAIARLDADGGTPIGQAMITAKRALDETGLTRRHLLVVTDGENTDGVSPDSVALAIGRRPDAERPSIYFVAFDVDANRFSRVRDAGGLILSAANATELNTTLDTLLSGKILVEK